LIFLFYLFDFYKSYQGDTFQKGVSWLYSSDLASLYLDHFKRVQFKKIINNTVLFGSFTWADQTLFVVVAEDFQTLVYVW